MPENSQEPHRRRPRYRGTHPRSFSEKYKELDPDRYPEDLARILARGATPAGSHRSIMVAEVLAALAPEPGDRAIDATLGHGGHALEILRAVQPGGSLLGLDRDPVELAKTATRLRAAGFAEPTFSTLRMNFAGLPAYLEGAKLPGADLLLADLGVSSMQIDDPGRGFTFKHEGPLDMRMDPEEGPGAAELLAALPEARLREILEDNADEPDARVIARVLTQRRGTLRTTGDLARAVRDALQGRLYAEEETRKAIRRTFQALRIEVNGEFRALETLLAGLPRCLAPGGRVVLLCFHSGEEGRIEASFRAGLEAGLYSSISETAQRPGAAERRDNPRSSSARLWRATRAPAASTRA